MCNTLTTERAEELEYVSLERMLLGVRKPLFAPDFWDLQGLKDWARIL